MWRILIITIVALAIAAFLTGYLSEGRAVDPDTGEACPGRFWSYDCNISEGEYRGFLIEADRRAIFDGICNRNLVYDFEYIIMEADLPSVPESLVEKYKPVRELFAKDHFPYGAASFFSRSFEEFCSQSDVEPYARTIAIRSHQLNRPAVLNLYFEDGKLESMYLAGHTIDL